jgi:hypothetical protein
VTPAAASVAAASSFATSPPPDEYNLKHFEKSLLQSKETTL